MDGVVMTPGAFSIADLDARRVADRCLSSMATAPTFLTNFCPSNSVYNDQFSAAIINHQPAKDIRSFQIV
jgi:hypothetical protein